MFATALVLVSLLGYGESNPLQVHLSTDINFKVGQKVLLKLSFTNEGKEDIYLFHQGTPLERIESDCFKITRNKSPISYDGPFYKRLAVNSQSEGSALKSNETKSVTVDLSSAYSVGTRGSYAAALLTKMFFHFSDGAIISADIQSPTVDFVVDGDASEGVILTSGQQHRIKWGNYSKEELKAGNVNLGAPKSVIYLGSYTTYDVSEANAAWIKAYSKLVTGISGLTNNPSHYYNWFGMYPTSTVWSNTFSLVKSSMEEDTFKLYFHGRHCRSNVYAYTYAGSRTIYLCGAYISAPDSGVDTKFGTLVHEMTHAVVATRDIAYGRRYARYLAQSYPSLAVENADNYEYYVETL